MNRIVKIKLKKDQILVMCVPLIIQPNNHSEHQEKLLFNSWMTYLRMLNQNKMKNRIKKNPNSRKSMTPRKLPRKSKWIVIFMTWGKPSRTILSCRIFMTTMIAAALASIQPVKRTKDRKLTLNNIPTPYFAIIKGLILSSASSNWTLNWST